MNKEYYIVTKNVRIPNPSPANPNLMKSYPEVFCAELVNIEERLFRRILNLELYLKEGTGISDEMITVDSFLSFDHFNLK